MHCDKGFQTAVPVLRERKKNVLTNAARNCKGDAVIMLSQLSI